jgi:hypothetical protein
VEAVVRGAVSAAVPESGAVLRVQPLRNGRACGEIRATAGLCGQFPTTVIRAYFEVPARATAARVSVGLLGSQGAVTIETVRFLSILEPDEVSHPLAIPPPAWSQAPPMTVRSVAVCCDAAADRELTRLLRACLGEKRVTALSPSDVDLPKVREDAVLLPDAALPPVLLSLEGLLKLSADRIVVVSLPAFARLSRGQAVVRRVEQADDPIHAKVVLSNFATVGFALHDVFSYAWPGRRPGNFTQNQFRKTAKLAAFCAKHGFETALVSVCQKDATSQQPVCLCRRTRKGALFVLDLEPAEAHPSTMGEPALAMHLLRSILGRAPRGLGQYTSPARSETEFRSFIRELPLRFDDLKVEQPDVPIEDVRQQLVTVGHADRSFGLPLRPKPLILVRTGLTSGDVESVYGALTWFKHLLRPGPFRSPYAERLASRFRLAWIPCVARWEGGGGWQRGGLAPPVPMELETDDAQVAAVIDVISRPLNRVRVALAKRDEAADRTHRWLPTLFAAFGPRDYLLPSVEEGVYFDDRGGFDWRAAMYKLEVIVERKVLDEDFHHQVLATGGSVVRLEVPGFDADFVAHSIPRTDLIATLLEQVIGMQFGLIAVNRGRAPVRMDGFAPVAPGHALIVERDALARYATDAG